MCTRRQSTAPTVAAPIVASTVNREASREASLEARMRRLRAGAAANILTSPLGIPTTATLGGAAQ